MRRYPATGALLFMAILYATPSAATIYRTVDAQGNVTFTNHAEKGAEPVKLKPLSVYSAPEFKTTNAQEAGKTPAVSRYQSVSILSPKADETVRDNPGNVTVTAGSEPALSRKQGHNFQFFLDGKPVGKPQPGATKILPGVDRGEHRVAVAVVSASGKLLKRSKAVRFFLHRQTIFNPARRGNQNQQPAPTPPGK